MRVLRFLRLFLRGCHGACLGQAQPFFIEHLGAVADTVISRTQQQHWQGNGLRQGLQQYAPEQYPPHQVTFRARRAASVGIRQADLHQGLAQGLTVPQGGENALAEDGRAQGRCRSAGAL